MVGTGHSIELYPSLSPAEADVYHKFIKENKSHKEIAQERGCKERTSMNLLSRARQKLKNCEETLTNR